MNEDSSREELKQRFVDEKGDFDLEKAFSRMEEIIETLQEGKAKLSDSVKLYSEGTILAELCKESIEEVNDRLIELTGKGSEG